MLRSYIIEMRNFILLLGFFCIAISFAFAQEVVYEGRLTDYDSEDDLSGVTVSAIANGAVVFSTSTGRRGSYTMKIPIGKVYTIKYTKNGYVTKVMKVDVTSVNEEDLPIGGRIMPPVDIDLFTERENVDFSFLEEEPVVEWDYDSKKFVMDWDRQVYARMKKKIEDKLEEAENQQKELDAKYNQLITEADKLYDSEEYKESLSKYEEALSIPGKESEGHPNNRILEIEELLQKIAEEELAEQQANQEYYNLIEAADNLLKQENYNDALTKYTEAQKLKEDEQYPQDQIDLIKEKLAEIEAASEAKEKYEAAIAKADELFGTETYEAAITKYKEALTYDSEAQYPKDRIEAAQEELDKLNKENEQQEAFNALVKEADELVVAGDFEDAIAKYEEALVMFNDVEVVTKKKKAEDLLKKDQESKEQEERIDELLTSANEKMSDEDYQNALIDYQEVLGLDENNTFAIEGKAAAEKAIARLKDQEEKQEQFDKLVDEADNAFESEEWEQAKNSYQAAKAIFGDDEHVNSQLDLVAEKINESDQQKQINEQIQNLLDQAADLKNKDEWKLVVDKYDEALALDDTRDDVRKLLESAKISLEEWNQKQEQQEQFNKIKTEGDQLFAQEKWTDAKSKYKEALEIKDDAEIKIAIEKIDEKLAELESEQEKEERFNQLIAEAESFESNDQLEDAISKYKEALKIKSSADVENKIAELEDAIEKLSESVKKQEEYEAAMEAGTAALDKDDFASAIKFFEDALLAIPMDPEATRLKNEAKDALSDLRSEEEKYNSLLSEAETAMTNDKLLEAKALYEEAQEMRPKATLPQDKIIEIDELLRKKEEELEALNEEEKLNQEYENKLELAQAAAGNFKYQEAIDHLKEASNLKPSEDFPKKKINEYQALLDQIAAQDAKEKKYNDLIQSADEAFDNESYTESIELYNKALEVKGNEKYPQTQIARAQEAIESAENIELNRKYNDLISKADQSFANEDYKDALGTYEAALKEKPGDQYSTDKIKETKQILDNLKSKEESTKVENEKYDRFIAQADDLFNRDEFIEAKKKYEAALEAKPNDTYAIKRIGESVERAKLKVEEKDDVLYNKIVSKADEYYGKENFEKAISLYERALSLRSYDQYPKDKIAEIKAIQNGTFVEEELEYLGEKEDISIVEGAALLEKAEDQRQNMKLDKVQTIINKNEGQELDRLSVDKEGQMESENEIKRIYDKRSKLARIEKVDKDNTIVNLDEQIFTFEKLDIQENNFERAEILRENENVTYIQDDYDEHRKLKYDDHSEAIETVKEIRELRDDRERAEQTRENVALLDARDQLVEMQDEQDNQIDRANEMQEDNELKVDRIQQDQEKLIVHEKNSEYQRIQETKSQALLAELSKEESEKEKQVIQDQLKEDIKRLEGKLIDKERDETRELYEEQLEADATLTMKEEQYQESQADNDDQREAAVEQLKELEEDKEKELVGRNEAETEETQENVEHAEFIEEKSRVEHSEHLGEKVELNEKVEDRAIRYEREVSLKEKGKEMSIENTSDNIERINISKEQELTSISEDLEENNEKLKADQAAIKAGDEVRREQLNKDKLKSQDLLDKMEAKKTKFNAEIANSLGEDFPEGVTQETYVRRDKDDIPNKIVTRRIVVVEGFGEVYMRIQTRNGVTYSKNGRPISEEMWIRGTEDADLEQHF